MKESAKEGVQVIAVNRHARHEFHIFDTFEAGMELRGSEVKSIRTGSVNLKEGYAHVFNGEVFLEGMHVSPYGHSPITAHEPTRSRRLLLHKREIERIDAEIQQKKLTLVPLRLYFSKGKAKIELGLAKGKKLHDKRASLKEKEWQRNQQRHTGRRHA